ncbi:MAG: glycoside hydrolase family 172 protein [Christensenellales bacterium]|jgi:hypothetical protein
MLYGNGLDTLFMTKNCRSRRVSTYAKDGTNHDFCRIPPWDTRELVNIPGAGICRHIWCAAIGSPDPLYLLKTVLRIYWDAEEHPSVEAPLGDFFGMGFGMRKSYQSMALSMNPKDGKGFNCYFPMPFSDGARLTITNESDFPINFYLYFDYEEYDELPGGQRVGRFHAQWRRQNPTGGWGNAPEKHISNQAEEYLRNQMWTTSNLSGEDNYIILEAEGTGHYVGCNLNIDCFARQSNDWYGEGDDMIFIDGEPWPPSLHGTGTEDYFCTAHCPKEEFSSLFSGITLYSADKEGKGRGWAFSGKNSMYRHHIYDPIHFSKSIKVTIEHGHNNKLSHDYSSTAYWYQLEPHNPQYSLPAVEKLLPHPDGQELPYEGKPESRA